MVFVRKTYLRAPVYEGDGLFSWARKAGKVAAKLVKNPVGKVVRNIYNKTLAPVAKQALTDLVGEKLTNSIENVGKRTLKGENIDSALVGETKSLAKSETQNALTGGRVGKPLRTSDIIRSTKVTKVIKPKASAVMQRIQGESIGGGLEEDTVL